MKTRLVRANADGSYNVPVSKNHRKQYNWMPPKMLGTAIRKQLGLRAAALIGYK